MAPAARSPLNPKPCPPLRDKDLAKDVQCMLEYTCLRNIISKTEVW